MAWVSAAEPGVIVYQVAFVVRSVATSRNLTPAGA